MKRIKGMTEVKVSVEDVIHLNELIDRDEAMPIVVKKYSAIEGTYDCCPRCNKIVVSTYQFCPSCGQRLDWENEAL